MARSLRESPGEGAYAVRLGESAVALREQLPPIDDCTAVFVDVVMVEDE